MFIYGSLLLMIGYTNNDLHGITGLKGGYGILLAVPQSLGLVLSNLMLRQVLKKYNLKTIMSFSYFFAVIFLIVISLLDKIVGYKENNLDSIPVSAKIHHESVAIFIACSFMLGLSIGLTSSVVSTYFGSIFSGKKRVKMLSLVSGFYCIGAGIIPLSATGIIYGSAKNSYELNQNFSHVRIFYLIAIGLAFCAFLSSFFLDYKYKSDRLFFNIYSQNQNKSRLHKKIFNPSIVILVIIICAMSSYIFSESVVNYSIVKFFQNSFEPSRHPRLPFINYKITAFRAYGLLIMIQGIWRCTSGLWITEKVSLVIFIYISSLFIILGYILLLNNIINKNENYAYLIAIIMGFGLGNTWSTIFSYSVSTKNQKAAYMGVVLNITTMFSILVTQIITSLIIPNTYINLSKTKGGMTILIMAIVFSVFIIIFIYTLSKYLKKVKYSKLTN